MLFCTLSMGVWLCGHCYWFLIPGFWEGGGGRVMDVLFGDLFDSSLSF